jgi:hypothetical protein
MLEYPAEQAHEFFRGKRVDAPYVGVFHAMSLRGGALASCIHVKGRP